MFVGCVVAGSVMLCCQGAKVRGALVRDVAAYAIAVVAVAIILWSGKVSNIYCRFSRDLRTILRETTSKLCNRHKQRRSRQMNNY